MLWRSGLPSIFWLCGMGQDKELTMFSKKNNFVQIRNTDGQFSKFAKKDEFFSRKLLIISPLYRFKE